MPRIKDAKPEVSVRLFKTISRKTVEGQVAASMRYQGKDAFIDLTPFLNAEGSSVRTTKSIREPAGGFSVTFSDMPQLGTRSGTLESVYGLVEPMDGIEIRMWGGVGPRPRKLPIIMRGFVAKVSRSQTMSEDGKPSRQVVITGQDYGKIWQMYQIIHLKAYAESNALLTTFALWELFGLKAASAKPAYILVKEAIEKIINPFLEKMLPKNWDSAGMPTKILTDDEDLTARRGKMNNSYQNQEGSIYSLLVSNTDVPTWNELYIEDREDGVHAIFRPIPALRIKDHSKIQKDAPDPIFVVIEDSDVQSISVERSESTVANFYWVNNPKYDLIDEIQRKVQALKTNDATVSTEEYPNSNLKYYGVRPLYASTQLSESAISTIGSGQAGSDIEKNSTKMMSWLEVRRVELMDMNKDNVVYEHGSARIKGGQMRSVGGESMKAGDYARFVMGRLTWDAYCVQIDHEFLPFSGYTQTVVFERGEGFVKRIELESGAWLTEQASRS